VELKNNSSEFVLPSDGPDRGFTHLLAFASADALAISFVEVLRRKGITTPKSDEMADRMAFFHKASSRLNDLVR
jgi:hypothetical protein